MTDKKILSEAYLDRDLSWMYFNHRILQEATKPRVPLLERLVFLGQETAFTGYFFAGIVQ